MMNSSTDRIEIFASFRNAMLSFFSMPALSKDDQYRKGAISHRIALSLERTLSPEYSIDIEIMGTDILVKKGGDIILALFWSSTYLTEKERSKALDFHRKWNPALTLAFSMLEDKDYLLIYRFESDYVDYLHIDKVDFSEMLLKRCMIEMNEESQLLLDVVKKRKRIRKA